MNRVLDAIGKLNPRLVTGIMLLIVSLLAIEGWMLVLRKPYAEYQQIIATRASLESTLSLSSDQSTDLEKLTIELKQLTEKLGAELRLPASDDEIAASLMEALDRSAAVHGVTLSGVKPKERKQVSVFEEVSFEITAKGSYLQLCEWMLDFGKTLGSSATITEFDMKNANEERKVALSLNIALYRPLKFNEVAK
ncbi:MAG: type 4a pilus biogenesis protein PilO [Sideroxyarcus sp.]|nr:type 4a pilus biogenesis protein PilO [Sideroxyarcus sp.]